MKAFWKRLRSIRSGAWAAALISLLVLLPAWFWGEAWYQANLVQQARAKVAGEMAAQADALISALNQRIALLQGLYAFTRTEWPDKQFDHPFEIYSSAIYFNSTGVRTLMIAPEGIARYVFPIADSAVLTGYDVLNDPDPAVRADVQRAIHTRTIVLSRPGKLRQGGFGVTAWQAVYRGNDLWGLISIAVDLNTVLGSTGITSSTNGLELALRDGSGQTFFGSADLWQRSPVTQGIVVPDGSWNLGGIPQGGWNAAIHPQLAVFRLGSVLITALIAAVIYLTVSRQDRLEEAVASRTRQIATAQQELEQRVQERTREVSEQAGKLAVFEERQRLARELHDSVSQVLFSIGLGAKTARAALNHDPSQIADALDYVNRLAEAGQVEMRALIFELRPESLRTDGLVFALEKQAAVLRARHGIAVHMSLCPEPAIPLAVKETLYRVSQEAIHNIVKHAHATQVGLALDCSADQVCLEIEDNGVGFDPRADFPGHLGLQSMRERAAGCGGTLQIDSLTGQGTKLQLRVPFKPPDGC
jgi:signal transduction histidine kinase